MEFVEFSRTLWRVRPLNSKVDHLLKLQSEVLIPAVFQSTLKHPPKPTTTTTRPSKLSVPPFTSRQEEIAIEDRRNAKRPNGRERKAQEDDPRRRQWGERGGGRDDGDRGSGERDGQACRGKEEGGTGRSCQVGLATQNFRKVCLQLSQFLTISAKSTRDAR